MRRHEAEALAAQLHVDGRPPARITEGTEEGRHRKLDPELLDLQVRHLDPIADQDGILIGEADVESESARRLGIEPRNDRCRAVAVS